MAHYHIKAVYRYEGVVEADSPEDAEKVFWAEMDTHYDSTEEYECGEVWICEDCQREVDDADEMSGDICDWCAVKGKCDECGQEYDTSSRDGRCGDCGNCETCCDHDNNEDGEE